MSMLQAIILGIIQGLTEFLPVSSSAHLVLVPFFFGWSLPADQAFAFDVLVQMGTLLAVIVYFRKDLLQIVVGFLQGIIQRRPFGSPQANMGWYLILATIPAGIFGLLVKDKVEAAFQSPVATALFLLGTAAILFISEWIGKRTRPLESLTWKDALWIGCAQAISIFPGISRSGSTIAGGLLRNIERKSAARFSFLMSIPTSGSSRLDEDPQSKRIPADNQCGLFDRCGSWLPVDPLAALLSYPPLITIICHLLHRCGAGHLDRGLCLASAAPAGVPGWGGERS